MIFDLINLGKLRRALVYALVMLIVMFFQTTLFSVVSPLGVRAMFLPAAVVAVGMFEGGVWGGVFGLCLGLLGDRSIAGNTVLFTILFPLLGFFAGLLADYFVNKRFFSYVLVCTTALLITALCQSFRLVAFAGAELMPVLRTVLLQTLWSLPAAVIVYFPCKALAKRSFG